jgi:hypothetical protein
LTMQDESKQVAKIMAQSAVFFGICCMIWVKEDGVGILLVSLFN